MINFFYDKKTRRKSTWKLCKVLFGKYLTVGSIAFILGAVVYNYRVHGNIGVTQVSQMLESEIKVREKYNLTVRILEAFTKKIFTLRDHVIVNVPVWDE